MRPGGGNWMPALVLAVVAGLSFWLERSVREEPVAAAPKPFAPDFWAERFTVRDFDRDGVLLHRIEARSMVHYADRDHIELQSPQLQLRDDGITTVTARQARIGARAERIDLDGNVEVVRRPVGRDAVASTLHSESLTIFPEQERLASSRAVRISRPGAVIRGSGLESDHRSGITSLGGRVRAEFQPRERS